MNIVDFHSHFVGPSFELTLPARVPPSQRSRWEVTNRRLASRDELLASIEMDGITARVISTPLEFVRNADGSVEASAIPRINDSIADLVQQQPGKLYGLATVDAYDGEVAAKELERAVKTLGLRGVFLESAKGDLLPNAKEARPTLVAAAALGVPVFLHPVPDLEMRRRFAACGRLTERLARATINSAALLAMLESGVFDECRGLRIVVTSLALGGLVLAGCFGEDVRLGRDVAAGAEVYVDTTGLHPAMIRSAVDLLGADKVVIGTDWPVVAEESLSDRVRAVLKASGLDATAQSMVAGGNAMRLLAVD